MMQNNFDITKEKADFIFEEVVFPLLSSGIDKSENKKAYIIGGQPGSGKSAFAELLLSQDGNLVFINGDDLRTYHPTYDSYLRENDQEAADMTQAVCNYWIESAIQKCLENGLSFIVEGTMRTTNAPLLTAKKAKEYGYGVYGCVIATPYDLSLASINYRYSEGKRLKDFVRYTKKESHDEAFTNLPRTVENLINSELFANFLVYKRLDGSFESRVGLNEKQEIINSLNEGRRRELTEREFSFVRDNIIDNAENRFSELTMR